VNRRTIHGCFTCFDPRASLPPSSTSCQSVRPLWQRSHTDRGTCDGCVSWPQLCIGGFRGGGGHGPDLAPDKFQERPSENLLAAGAPAGPCWRGSLQQPPDRIVQQCVFYVFLGFLKKRDFLRFFRSDVSKSRRKSLAGCKYRVETLGSVAFGQQ